MLSSKAKSGDDNGEMDEDEDGDEHEHEDDDDDDDYDGMDEDDDEDERDEDDDDDDGGDEDDRDGDDDDEDDRDGDDDDDDDDGGDEDERDGDDEDEMASPGFHAALSLFPSHLFPAVAKVDGSLYVGDDLMWDLWQDKDPNKCERVSAGHKLEQGLKWHFIVQDLIKDKDWVRAFVKKLWGWILVTLCTRCPDVRTFWEKESPGQVDTIRLYLKNAREAGNTG
jgi:hypothetical protein